MGQLLFSFLAEPVVPWFHWLACSCLYVLAQFVSLLLGTEQRLFCSQPCSLVLLVPVSAIQQVAAPLYSCSLPHSSLPAGNLRLAWTNGAPAKMLKMIDPDAQVAPAVSHLYPETSCFLLLLVYAEHSPVSYAVFLA